MSEGQEWDPLAFVFVLVGFILVTLALSGARAELTGAGGAVEGLVLAGFVSLLGCFTLATLGQYGQLQDGQPQEIVAIVNVAAAFLSALLILIAVILYGCRVNRKPPPYTTTLLVCGAIMAALGGTFYTLDIVSK